MDYETIYTIEDIETEYDDEFEFRLRVSGDSDIIQIEEI